MLVMLAPGVGMGGGGAGSLGAYGSLAMLGVGS